MVCKRCGSLLEDDVALCPDCGADPKEPLKVLLANDDANNKPTENTQHSNKKPIKKVYTEDKQKSNNNKKHHKIDKKEKKLNKSVLLAIVAIFLVVFISISIYSNTTNKIARAFEKGDYEVAYSIYKEKYSSQEKVSASLIRKLKKYITNMRQDFDDSEISYSDANNALNVIEDMRIDELTALIIETSEYLNAIENSRHAYTEAKKYHSTGDYRNAIIYYKQVISEDENYHDTVDCLTEIIELYRTQVLNAAEVLFKNGDVLAAIDDLRYALDVLKNDKELKNVMDGYIYSRYEAVRTDALEDAAAFVLEQNYPSAISIVKNLLDDNADDEILIDAYNTYISDYETYILNEATAFYGADKYFEAIDILDEGLIILENNSNLLEKRELFNANVPIDLLTLSPTAFENWTPNKGSLKDSKGNQQKPRVSYIVVSDSEVTYDLNGLYRKLDAQIVPQRDFSNNLVGQLVIHADGVLVYSTPAITKSTNQFGFSIDLEGVKEITISTSGNTDDANISLILMDMLLFELS